MEDDRFSWNDKKARSNLAKHEIDFVDARLVFEDDLAFDVYDDREHYGEDRFNTVGMVNGQLLSVAHTERKGRIHLISARKANKREHNDYYRQGT